MIIDIILPDPTRKFLLADQNKSPDDHSFRAKIIIYRCCNTAFAAAKRAMGTRYGEQLT